MAVTFTNDWNQAKPNYVANYGEYQAFLDAISQDDVRDALADANGHFQNQAAEAIAAALNPGQTLEVRQGTHQAEDIPNVGGGFMLHFTARRLPGGPTYHLYVGQRSTGAFFIRRISWGAGPHSRQDRA